MSEFTNLKYPVTGSLATVGTIAAPASGKAHVVIGINVANTHATDTTAIDVVITDSEDPAVDTYIAKNVSIPAGGSLGLLTGKVVLITGDVVKAKFTGGSADLVLSLLKDA